MPLKSHLFKGDNKLERCLVNNADHVVPGSSGAHVVKIQKALNLLGGVVIPDTEISRGFYGDKTVEAVLAFKTKFNLVQSYEQTPDPIVGIRTIAKLDDMMDKREKGDKPAPPPPVLGIAGVQIGPVGPRSKIIESYYRNCGLETVGPGQVRTGQMQHFQTFEGLIDLLLTRSETQQVIVNHGSPTDGLLVPLVKESSFSQSGQLIGTLSILADREEKGQLDANGADKDFVKDVSGPLHVADAVVLRLVRKIVQVRKKKFIYHFRACNLASTSLVQDYKACLGARMITFHSVRLLFINIAPAKLKAGLALPRTPPGGNTAKARMRVFDDPLGLLPSMVIGIVDVDGHTNVQDMAIIEDNPPGAIREWADFMVGEWREANASHFSAPVMWDNGETTFHLPREAGWREKLKFV